MVAAAVAVVVVFVLMVAFCSLSNPLRRRRRKLGLVGLRQQQPIGSTAVAGDVFAAVAVVVGDVAARCPAPLLECRPN